MATTTRPRPATKSQRAALEAQLARLEPGLALAFFQAIARQRSAADVSGLVRALKAGDIDRAVQALNLSPAMLAPLEDAMRAAYRDTGARVMEGIGKVPDPRSGLQLNLAFDGRNPRAELWLFLRSGTKIGEISRSIRDAARLVLQEGMGRGENPERTARALVGEWNRVAGKRTGGLIGLHSVQVQAVQAAREELSDPTTMAQYLRRARRDRRFDRSVTSALRREEPLEPGVLKRMVERYADGLLQLRGEAIARTETMSALGHAQHEAFAQVMDHGAIRPEQVRRIWRSAGDARVRHSHTAINGQVRGWDERFSNGLMFPGDSGGRASEVINCRCVVEIRVDYFSGIT